MVEFPKSSKIERSKHGLPRDENLAVQIMAEAATEAVAEPAKC